jgi:hypothetical protein
MRAVHPSSFRIASRCDCAEPTSSRYQRAVSYMAAQTNTYPSPFQQDRDRRVAALKHSFHCRSRSRIGRSCRCRRRRAVAFACSRNWDCSCIPRRRSWPRCRPAPAPYNPASRSPRSRTRARCTRAPSDNHACPRRRRSRSNLREQTSGLAVFPQPVAESETTNPMNASLVSSLITTDDGSGWKNTPGAIVWAASR